MKHTTSPQPHWWQRSAQAIASSRYGSKLASRLLPRIDAVLRLSGNSLRNNASHVPVVMRTARRPAPHRPLLALGDNR